MKISARSIAQRTTLVVVALVFMPLMAFVLFNKPASAAFSDCSAARLCLWEHENYQGVRVAYAVNPPGTCVNVPISMNDKFSSFKNGLSQSVTLYYLANCSQGVDTHPVPAGAYRPDMPLGDFIWTWNDVVSSIKFN